MKNKELLSLIDAFDFLSGLSTKIVGDKEVKVPFVFSTENRWKIAKNTRKLKKHKEEYQDAIDALIKQNGGPFLRSDQTGFFEFKKDEQELLNKNITDDLCLEKISRNDFDKVDDKGVVVNNIPPAVLELLMDYIE